MISAAHKSSQEKVTFTNTPYYGELPEAGGTGTLSLMLSGALLILLALRALQRSRAARS